MSDIETTNGPETTAAAGEHRSKARAALDRTGQTLRHEAQSFAATAQQRARAEAQRRAQTATKTMHDFANAVRRAGDDLAEHDQSPAAQLVRQAADGLENLSRNLADKQPEDLVDAVRDFGRRHPTAFIGGAVLAGIALGRFIRASEAGGEPLGAATDARAYPRADAPAYAAGAAAVGEEALGLAEEESLQGEAEFAGAGRGGIERPIADDLGDLKPSDIDESASVLGVEETTPPDRRES